MWQWKVSEEGENQGSSSTVDSKQSGRAGGGPTTGKEQSPHCGWQTDWGPGLDDKGTLLRKLRAHQRNEEQERGRELTPSRNRLKEPGSDPDEATGMGQLKGGQRRGRKAGAQRAG